jgi:Domain of unknown function (DUF397)
MNEQDLSQGVWQKSSYSNGQANCVEVARNLPGIVAVRDSKDPDGELLRVSRDEWRAFLAYVRVGQHDCPCS